MTPQSDFDATTGGSTIGRTVVGLFHNRQHAEAAHQ